MKSYSILALMTFLLLGNISLAHAAGACVDLSKAIALADWAVKVNKYSQGDRSCSACTSKHPSGMPGAPVVGPPNVTGMCCSYDCSSLVTWVVRQVPGQTGFPPNNVAPPSTYAIWGPGGPKEGGSPNGWKPCDPSKQPLCAGLGNWGADGKSGPGTVSVALCGKHYHANCTGCSPDITDSYKPLSGGTTQGSGSKIIVWVTPPGLEALTTASCSSTCTSTSAAISPSGQGSASPTGSSAAPVSSSSNSSSSDTMSQMMPMMMMSMMMQQMMQMMKPQSNGSNASSGSGNGTGSSSGGSSSGGLGDLLGGLLGKPGSSSGSGSNNGGSNNGGSGNNGSGSSNGTSNNNNAAASPSDILKTLVSTLVTRLKAVLTSIFTNSSAQTATAAQSSSPASTASVLQQQLQQLEEQRAVVKTTTGSAATSSAIVSQPEGSGAVAAPVNPTQDWHKADGEWSGDRRLSCAGLSGKNAASCRGGRTPSMSP